MYTVQFYYETKEDLIKDKESDYISYKTALSEAKKYVQHSKDKAAYIYSGIEESRELLTGVHQHSVINHVDVRWLS